MKLPRLIDYAAECILLRKVGGGYIFVHRLLLEYFASFDTTADQSAPEPATEQNDGDHTTDRQSCYLL